MDQQWGEISKLGAIGGTVWIFGRFLWPFLMRQVDKSESRQDAILLLMKEQRNEYTAELRDQRKDHMEALRSRDVLAQETHKDQMKAYNQIAAEFKELNTFIRNGNGK